MIRVLGLLLNFYPESLKMTGEDMALSARIEPASSVNSVLFEFLLFESSTDLLIGVLTGEAVCGGCVEDMTSTFVESIKLFTCKLLGG